MNLRTIAACLAASSVLLFAACGDDDDENGGNTGTQTQQQSAEGGTVKDIEPRTAKPNIAGGNAPIEQFVKQYAEDAIGYWEQVFQNSSLPYTRPTAQIASSPTENECGGQFDPSQSPGSYFCSKPNGPSIVYYGAPFYDQTRNSLGDAPVAFLTGFGVALDANEQASGKPIASGQQPTSEFLQVTACWTGAWVRNLNDRQLLEAGDTDEMLALAARFLPAGPDAEIRKQVVTYGFENGAGPCQTQYGGGGGAPEETPQSDG